MDKRTYLATYTVVFAAPDDAKRLSIEQFGLAMFSFLDSGHLLLVENDEDTLGVEHGDLEAVTMRQLNPLVREYDVRHRVSIEDRPGEDPDERVSKYLAEALGIPQQEGRWQIRSLDLHFVGSDRRRLAAR